MGKRKREKKEKSKKERVLTFFFFKKYFTQILLFFNILIFAIIFSVLHFLSLSIITLGESTSLQSRFILCALYWAISFICLAFSHLCDNIYSPQMQFHILSFQV